MKTLNWNNIRLLLMLVSVSFLYAFSLERNKNRLVSEIQVEFLGESQLFITEEMVNNLLIENFTKPKKILKHNLFLKPLENVLTNHPMIENAEVSVSTDGKLKAQVKQKTPMARVYEKNTCYYMDYHGTKMPLSENFSARVPIVSGKINDLNKTEITTLLQYIYEDNFLKKNIISVAIDNNNNVIMKNRNYNYNINFGKPTDIKQKFNNYKAFFQIAPLQNNVAIDKYKNIDLTFTKQVICTK